MEVREKPLENTFSFVFGEKENEVQLQCTLFQGDFRTVIGSLPCRPDVGNNFFDDFSFILCSK